MGIDRRSIVKLIIGGAVGSMFTPIPWKLTDDLSIWSQNWPWIPKNIKGKDEFKPTVSKLCPSAAAMLVRTVDGRPVRTSGNPDHPLAGGTSITAMAATEVQMCYSPSRVKRPLVKQADGGWKEVAWSDALKILDEKLGAIKGAATKLAVVSGDQTGTVNEVLSGFVSAMGSKNFFLMPSELQPLAKAWELMGGAGQPGFETDGADYVLAIGADILESWGPVLRQRKAFSASRPHGAAPKSTYVYVGPTRTNTAVGADLWVPAKPGAQAAVALGLANLLIQGGASFPAGDFAAFKALAAKFTPAEVAKLAGVSEASLAKIAEGLKNAKAPVVIAGSEYGQGGSTAAAQAGIALNLLLGAFNKKAGLRAVPEFGPAVARAMSRKAILANDLPAYVQAMAKDPKAMPEVLVTYEANPVYSLPGDMKDVLAKVPFKVAMAQFMDETAAQADLVLPSPMGLERADDVATPLGCGMAVYSQNTPVIEPLWPAIHGGDVILGVSAKLGANLGFNTFKDVLAAKAKAVGADAAALAAGKAFTSDAVAAGQLTLAADALAKSLELKPAEGAYALAATYRLNFGTPTASTPPPSMKTLRETELKQLTMYVHLNKATAAKAGLSTGDKIYLVSGPKKTPALVNVTETVMDGVVMAPFNMGHSAFDAYTRGKGANLATLFTAQVEPGSGISVWPQAGVSIEKA